MRDAQLFQMQSCDFEDPAAASKDEQVQLNMCMICILFFVFLSLCYLCGTSHLNNVVNMTPAFPPHALVALAVVNKEMSKSNIRCHRQART